MTAAQWVAAIVPIAVALAGGGLAWRSLKRQQDAQAGHSTSQALGDYVDEARKELERVELLRIEMEGTIHDLFVRIDVLEVEVIRLGGDPTKLNGRH
jgi:hypothetical protein